MTSSSVLSSSSWKMAHVKLFVIFICLCSEVLKTVADVIATSPNNDTIRFDSLPAAFGASIKPSGIQGFLAVADPPDACSEIKGPPQPPADQMWSLQFFVLIIRGKCDFDIKVLNAQKAGYMGAIVYNDESDVLTTMSGGSVGSQVIISSVFVGLTSGTYLKGMNYTTRDVITLTPGFYFPYPWYLIPFASGVGICFIAMLFFMVAKYVRDSRRRRKARLSRDHLKKLPVRKFQKGDDYDVCAICLDDYEEGQKLRILPCNHAFHCKCVDPWLTNNRKTCPICKRKVVPPGMTDSDDSDSDSEAGEGPDENTPLLAGMEREDSSEHGAVGGAAALNTPPPSPNPSIGDDEGENVQGPVVSLINVDSDTSSADSYPMEEAPVLRAGRPRNVSVTVHSESEVEGSNSLKA